MAGVLIRLSHKRRPGHGHAQCNRKMARRDVGTRAVAFCALAPAWLRCALAAGAMGGGRTGSRADGRVIYVALHGRGIKGHRGPAGRGRVVQCF